MTKTFDLGLFRAQKKVEHPRLDWRPTIRWPGNVPYLVDNLWEWRRWRQFGRYPSRRHALFVYARKELADQYVAENPDAGLTVYRIILHGGFRLCQVPGLRDSRHHADCKAIPQEVYRILGKQGLVEDKGWAAGVTLNDKHTVGSLWIPGLTAEEVEALRQASHVVRHLLEAVEPCITYWKDFLFVDENMPGLGSGRSSLFDDGEIFFEPIGGYELRPA